MSDGLEADQEMAYRILRNAFSILDSQSIENFRYHLSRETPVLCGADFVLWSDQRGAG